MGEFQMLKVAILIAMNDRIAVPVTMI